MPRSTFLVLALTVALPASCDFPSGRDQNLTSSGPLLVHQPAPDEAAAKLGPAITRAAEALTVEATRLQSDYVKNPVLADSRYLGRRLRVEGMGTVRRDGSGRDYFGFHVALGSLQSPGGDVRAWIGPAVRPDFAKPFKIPDRVVIDGTCRGIVQTWDAYLDTAVILDDCRLLSWIPVQLSSPGPPTRR
jgi:tRNA_anti-like